MRATVVRACRTDEVRQARTGTMDIWMATIDSLAVKIEELPSPHTAIHVVQVPRR